MTFHFLTLWISFELMTNNFLDENFSNVYIVIQVSLFTVISLFNHFLVRTYFLAVLILLCHVEHYIMYICVKDDVLWDSVLQEFVGADRLLIIFMLYVYVWVFVYCCKTAHGLNPVFSCYFHDY